VLYSETVLKLPKMAWALLALLVVSFPAVHFLVEVHANNAVEKAILASTKSANIALAGFLATELQARLGSESTVSGAAPSAQAHARVDAFVRAFLMETDLISLGFYRPDGTVLYTTHTPSNSIHKNPFFSSAAQGVPENQLMVHDQTAMHVVQTHLPVRDPSGRVIGVMIMEADRTALIGPSAAHEAHLHYYLLVAQTIQLLLVLFIGWFLRGYVLELHSRIRLSA
jgi:hypothetical protein